MVIEGECVCTTASGKVLSRLVPGDYFGEMALVFGGARAANVDAICKTRCAVLDGEAFGMLDETLRVKIRVKAEARRAAAASAQPK